MACVVVTGPVGAGKTTAARAALELLRGWGHEAEFVPEYIEAPGGAEMLGRRLRGEVSPAEFQRYILDYYRALPPADGLRIFERSPVDSPRVFCRMDVASGRMDEGTAAVLEEESERVCSALGLPLYRRGDSAVVLRNASPAWAALSVAAAAIEAERSGVPGVVVLLPPPGECLRRIRERGRPEERGYDTAYVEAVGSLYEELAAEVAEGRE